MDALNDGPGDRLLTDDAAPQPPYALPPDEATGLGFRTDRGARTSAAPGLAGAAAGLAVVGLLPFAGAGRVTGLLLALAWLALFGWAAMSRGVAAWARGPDLRWPAGLYAGVLAVGLLQLTPWLPGGAHPAWAFAPHGLGAVTLDRPATVIELVKLAGLAAAFLVGLAVGLDPVRGRGLFRGLSAGALALGLGALAVFVGSPGRWLGVSLASGSSRLTAPFLVADSAAAALGVLCLLTAAALYDAIARDQKAGEAMARWRVRPTADVLVPAAALAVCAVDLYLTASRAGLVATIAAALLMVGTASYRAAKRRIGPTSVAVLIVCVVVVCAALGAVGAPYLESARADGSTGLLIHRMARLGADAADRVAIYQTHLRAAGAAPLFGYGYGAWPEVNELNLSLDNFERLWRVRAAHDLYLQWLEEGGVVGAGLMFAAATLLLVRMARTALASGRRRLTPDALLAAAVLLAALNVVDFSLQQPAIAALLALLMGVGCAGTSRRG